MMANNRVPIFNNVAPSWADLNAFASGLDLPLFELDDINAINTSSALEVGEQSLGGRVVATTTGMLKNEFSVTYYASGFNKFLERLADACFAFGGGYVRGDVARVGLVHFNMHFMYTPPNSEQIDELELNGIRYTGRTRNVSQGTDANMVEVTYHAKEIVDTVNGKRTVLL
jgi:hypothetical protein